ncbi:MAG TPA: hypothetical protein PL034_00890 [Candidatus Paceibacterota bacterium]|nr:hypothetical protein [Candidatus Paceibacterota bacterium]
MKKDIYKSLGPILKWVFISLSTIIIILFISFIVVRFFHYKKLDKDQKQIEIIHSTKINLADVLGENLPKQPENPNQTIAGVDINKNGIRDDVELSIFEKYPDSAKTRSALLQYAQVWQMIMTQDFSHEEVATEIAREDSRADACLADTISPRESPESFRDYAELLKIDEYISFLEKIQFNTEQRAKVKEDFYTKVRSFSDIEEKDRCDIDYSLLAN